MVADQALNLQVRKDVLGKEWMGAEVALTMDGQVSSFQPSGF